MFAHKGQTKFNESYVKFVLNTFAVFFANESKACPCCLKILTLALRRSFLSIPSLRGMAPTKIATSMSLKAVLISEVGTTSGNGENANLLFSELLSRE